jgi:hypothetical protein
MKARIEKALRPLLGLAVWSSGRALDLQWFAIGPRRTVTTAGGQEKIIGEYALHVQCAWRIVRGEKVVVADIDLYEPRDENQPVDAAKGRTLLDKSIAELFAGETRSFAISRVEVGAAGAVRIIMSDHALEIFPRRSGDAEHWRLFRGGTEDPHFVVTGLGIEDDSDDPRLVKNARLLWVLRTLAPEKRGWCVDDCWSRDLTMVGVRSVSRPERLLWLCNHDTELGTIRYSFDLESRDAEGAFVSKTIEEGLIEEVAVADVATRFLDGSD